LERRKAMLHKMNIGSTRLIESQVVEVFSETYLTKEEEDAARDFRRIENTTFLGPLWVPFARRAKMPSKAEMERRIREGESRR
jgi:hypothetical protein